MVNDATATATTAVTTPIALAAGGKLGGGDGDIGGGSGVAGNGGGAYLKGGYRRGSGFTGSSLGGGLGVGINGRSVSNETLHQLSLIVEEEDEDNNMASLAVKMLSAGFSHKEGEAKDSGDSDSDTDSAEGDVAKKEEEERARGETRRQWRE